MSDFVAVDDTLRVIQHCLTIGRFDYNYVVMNLESIVATAKLAKQYVGSDATLCTDADLKRFADLETSVRNLSDAQVASFDALNALMFEHPFYQNLTNAATMLTLYLADTVYDVTKPIVDDFQKMSQKEQPMSYVTKLIANLKNDFTNPMKNFKNYEDTNFGGFQRLNVLDGIMAQLLFVEAFSNGFFFGGNMTNAKKMRDRIAELRTGHFARWEEEFLNNDPLHAARFVVQTCVASGGYQIDDVSTNVVLIGSIGLDVARAVRSPEEKALRERLNRLSKDLGNLANVMVEKLDAEKTFMEQHNFYEQYVVRARNLEARMIQAVADPSAQKIADFENAYNSSPVTTMADNLIAGLQNASTNILMLAMTADKYKSAETFDKWAGLIRGLMAQLLFIECFKVRVSANSPSSTADQLSFKIEKLQQNLLTWSADYKDNYWPSVVTSLVSEIGQNNAGADNQTLSETVNGALARIMTNDTLTTFVFNDGVADKRQYTSGTNDYMLTLNTGGRNVIVGRSRRARNVNPQRIEQIRNQFEEYYDEQRQDDYTPFVTQLGSSFGVGFVAMINESQNLGLAYTSEYPPAVMSAMRTVAPSPDYFSLFIGIF